MGVLMSCLNLLTGFAKSVLGKNYRFGAPDSFMRVGSFDFTTSNQFRCGKFAPKFADVFSSSSFHFVAIFKHEIRVLKIYQSRFALSSFSKSFVSRLIEIIFHDETSNVGCDYKSKNQLRILSKGQQETSAEFDQIELRKVLVRFIRFFSTKFSVSERIKEMCQRRFRKFVEKQKSVKFEILSTINPNCDNKGFASIPASSHYSLAMLSNSSCMAVKRLFLITGNIFSLPQTIASKVISGILKVFQQQIDNCAHRDGTNEKFGIYTKIINTPRFKSNFKFVRIPVKIALNKLKVEISDSFTTIAELTETQIIKSLTINDPPVQISVCSNKLKLIKPGKQWKHGDKSYKQKFNTKSTLGFLVDGLLTLQGLYDKNRSQESDRFFFVVLCMSPKEEKIDVRI